MLVGEVPSSCVSFQPFITPSSSLWSMEAPIKYMLITCTGSHVAVFGTSLHPSKCKLLREVVIAVDAVAVTPSWMFPTEVLVIPLGSLQRAHLTDLSPLQNHNKFNALSISALPNAYWENRVRKSPSRALFHCPISADCLCSLELTSMFRFQLIPCLRCFIFHFANIGGKVSLIWIETGSTGLGICGH
ncbi:hypothetical protein ACLOJK_011091 [Asimina triloba]